MVFSWILKKPIKKPGDPRRFDGKWNNLLFAGALTPTGRLTGLAAIIHAVWPASLCAFGTVVHFTVTTWGIPGISGSESKGYCGKQHHYNDEKKTSHDL
jgi:hypothetical protein